MRTFAALGSVDADATVEAVRNVVIEHVRHHHVVNSFLVEHILTVEIETS